MGTRSFHCAGMVEEAEQYTWSSAAVHLELEADARGLLDQEWGNSDGRTWLVMRQ